MFSLLPNQVIKIHKGDCSGALPLFLNQGTTLEPIQYKFYNECEIINSTEGLNPTFNKSTFYTVTTEDGFYDFEYNYKYNEQGQIIGELGWYLNAGETTVNLATYGITALARAPKINDHIVIARFKDHISEVYFYILFEGMPVEKAFVTKTFQSNGTIITAYSDPRLPQVSKTVDNLIDSNNMILFLDSDDTKYLKPGEYCYQIRAKLYDINSGIYSYNTVTNQLPFIISEGLDSSIIATQDSISELNCIYGKLNQRVKELEYQGGTTNTATVHINDHVITVDANSSDTEKIKLLDQEYASLVYNMDALNTTQQAMQESIKTINTALASLQTTVLSISSQVTIINAQISNLDARVKALEEK